MIEIPLTKGQVALIDDEYYELVSQYRWQAHKRRYTYYAEARTTKNPRSYLIMHRLIMECFLGRPLKPGEQIDHINGNGYDNRIENLRVCSNQENCRNKCGRKGASKYKGVHWNSWNKKWAAQIGLNYKRLHLGYFLNEEDAAKAYNKAAEEYFGEFAYLNILEE